MSSKIPADVWCFGSDTNFKNFCMDLDDMDASYQPDDRVLRVRVFVPDPDVADAALRYSGYAL